MKGTRVFIPLKNVRYVDTMVPSCFNSLPHTERQGNRGRAQRGKKGIKRLRQLVQHFPISFSNKALSKTSKII